MNIAYQAVVLFIYMLPGVIFRRRMSTAGHFRQERTLADEFAGSVLAAIVAHFVWITIINGAAHCFQTPRVSLEAAFEHVMGQFGKDSNQLNPAIRAVTDNTFYVVVYFVSISAAAAYVGDLVRIYRKTCDRSIFDWLEDEPSVERFKTWAAFIPEPRPDSAAVGMLATIVDVGKTAYLYVGQIEHIQWASSGDPDTFFLTDVIRREFNATSDKPRATADGAETESRPGEADDTERGIDLGDPDRFYQIEGDVFIIRASEAKTLNVLVYYLEPAEPA